MRKYNPERSLWRGFSYKVGGKNNRIRISELRLKDADRHDPWD